MIIWRTALAVFWKDLLLERKTKEIIYSTGLFALLVVVLSAFAFDLNRIPSNIAGAGVLWIGISFGGILALGRTYLREREFGVWTGLLMSPAPRAGLYLGKVCGLATFLIVVELLLIPLIELFFRAPMISHLPHLLPILVLGTVGFSAAGSLFGAMTIRTSFRDLLLGVVLFPLVAPVLIASVKATEAVLSFGTIGAATDYLELLAIFDVVFLILGLWLFDVLMED